MEEYAYYFGKADENRIEFSHGRDIRLMPGQRGCGLNYFIYPYVEVDGKTFNSLEVKFDFEG